MRLARHVNEARARMLKVCDFRLAFSTLCHYVLLQALIFMLGLLVISEITLLTLLVRAFCPPSGEEAVRLKKVRCADFIIKVLIGKCSMIFWSAVPAVTD